MQEPDVNVKKSATPTIQNLPWRFLKRRVYKPVTKNVDVEIGGVTVNFPVEILPCGTMYYRCNDGSVRRLDETTWPNVEKIIFRERVAK